MTPPLSCTTTASTVQDSNTTLHIRDTTKPADQNSHPTTEQATSLHRAMASPSIAQPLKCQARKRRNPSGSLVQDAEANAEVDNMMRKLVVSFRADAIQLKQLERQAPVSKPVLLPNTLPEKPGKNNGAKGNDKEEEEKKDDPVPLVNQRIVNDVTVDHSNANEEPLAQTNQDKVVAEGIVEEPVAQTNQDKVVAEGIVEEPVAQTIRQKGPKRIFGDPTAEARLEEMMRVITTKVSYRPYIEPQQQEAVEEDGTPPKKRRKQSEEPKRGLRLRSARSDV